MDTNIIRVISEELYDQIHSDLLTPSNDEELFFLLRAFEYVNAVTMMGPTMVEKYGRIKKRLSEMLHATYMSQRIKSGASDVSPQMRGLCSRFILANQIDGYEDIAFFLLNDKSEFVRQHICETLYHYPIPSTVPQLIQIAQNDASPNVRAKASYALAKGEPIKVIPILLSIYESDKDVAENSVIDSPSSHAAGALDELMKTNWMSVRNDKGIASLRPGGSDGARLKEHAERYLSRLKHERAEE